MILIVETDGLAIHPAMPRIFRHNAYRLKPHAAVWEYRQAVAAVQPRLRRAENSAKSIFFLVAASTSASHAIM